MYRAMCAVRFSSSTSILTLSVSEVWLCAVLSLPVTALFILFITKYSRYVDEDFSRAAGINAGACNLLTAVITAVIA